MAPLVVPFAVAPSTVSNAHEDCGNSGRLKNSFFPLCSRFLLIGVGEAEVEG